MSDALGPMTPEAEEATSWPVWGIRAFVMAPGIGSLGKHLVPQTPDCGQHCPSTPGQSEEGAGPEGHPALVAQFL